MGWFEDLFIEEAKPALKRHTEYNLPIATETVLGGVKPVATTEAMTQPVGVDSEGRLFADRDTDIDKLETGLKSTLLEHADLHLGFYLDENGDLCQKED